jgi:hypothetical protein
MTKKQLNNKKQLAIFEGKKFAAIGTRKKNCGIFP